MNPLVPGDVCYVDYGEAPQCVHTRLMVGVVDRATHEFMILTPDMDSYIEVLDSSNSDFAAFYRAGRGAAIPPGLNPAIIYGFAPMSAQDLARHLQQGRADADQERILRGLGAMPVVGAPAADDSIWILATMVEGRRHGGAGCPAAGFSSAWGLWSGASE